MKFQNLVKVRGEPNGNLGNFSNEGRQRPQSKIVGGYRQTGSEKPDHMKPMDRPLTANCYGKRVARCIIFCGEYYV